MATGDLHLRILRMLLAGAGAFVAAALHQRGFNLRHADARERLASTRRDGLNILALGVLMLTFWLSGHEGPVALVTSGTLLVGLETWRHRSPARAPTLVVTVASMLTVAFAEHWNVLAKALSGALSS